MLTHSPPERSTVETPTPATAAEAPSMGRTALAATIAGLSALVAALLIAHGIGGTAAGLVDPGPLTRWGLPAGRLVQEAAATVTLGFLLLAVLLPAEGGKLGYEAQRAMRRAAVAADVWATATAAVLVLTQSDIVGVPITGTFVGDSFLRFVTDVDQGRALALVVALALTVAAVARLAIGRRGACALFVLGLGALIPPALTGHSSTGDLHNATSISLVLHLTALGVWVGGLVAVSWYAARAGRHLPRVAESFSSVALFCYLAVVASGVLNAYARLQSWADLVTTDYGRLLTAKVALAVALAWFGAAHRRRTLGALQVGKPGAFRRLAAGEVVVMAATMAIGVALSRTAPPAPAEDHGEITGARELLGFMPPPELSPARLLTSFYPDAVFAVGCLGAALCYLAGVWRLRQRGVEWPVGRTVSWLLAVSVIAAATLSGVRTYGTVLLSVHLSQHVMLLVAPVLLVLGAPVTLALGALGQARRGERGARDVIVSVAQSRAVRFLTHPLVAFLLFAIASLTVVTPLFEYEVRHQYAHLGVHVCFLAVGYLFAEAVAGVDPLRTRLAYPARAVLGLAAIAVYAFVGFALVNAGNLVAESWFRELRYDIRWLPDPFDDQRLAGAIAIGAGAIAALVLVAMIVARHVRGCGHAARDITTGRGWRDVPADR